MQRKKNLFVIFFFFFSFALYCQKIQSRIELLEKEPEKRILLFFGETDLPEQTSLRISLWFEGQERREAKGHGTVKNGKFAFQYGPFSKPLPSGEYVWKIETRSRKIYPALPHKKVYFHGSLLQRQKEIQAQMAFWQNILKDLRFYQDSLKKQKETLLKQKQQIESPILQKILQQFYSDFRKIESQIREEKEKYALLRGEDSFWKIDSLLNCIAQYRDMTTLKIFVFFSLPLQKSFQEILKKFPDSKAQEQELRYYEEIIHKSLDALANSLPLPANIKEKELEEDIVSFNRIFKKLQIEYQKAQKNFQPENWKQAIIEIEEEREAFLLRIQDYSSSPLVLKYPDLVENLRKLEENIKNLTIHYNTELYRKAMLSVNETKATDTKEKSLETLQSVMKNLLEIISNHKKEQQETQEKAMQNLQKGISLLHGLQEEAQKGLKIEKIQEFLLWSEDYKKKQEEFSRFWQENKALYPDIQALANRAVFILQHRVEFQKKILQGQRPLAEHSIHLKELDFEVALILRRIQKEVEKYK